VRDDSWPFRRSDALFVVAVVLVALPAEGTNWGLGASPAMKFGIVVVALSAWIRFRVFGRSDRGAG
jgi:hypothetical protein